MFNIFIIIIIVFDINIGLLRIIMLYKIKHKEDVIFVNRNKTYYIIIFKYIQNIL